MQTTNIPTFNDINEIPRNLSLTFLAAWLTGTTGFLLSILAIISQWFLPSAPAEPVLSPVRSMPITSPPVDLKLPPSKPVSISSGTPVAQLRTNVDRHVSFSLEPESKEPIMPQKRKSIPPPCIETLQSPGSSINSADSITLVSPPSPHACSIDLPPLENISLLPLESNQVEPVPTKLRSSLGLGSPPISFNPFKSRRRSSSSSSRVISSPHSDNELPPTSPSDKTNGNSSRRFLVKKEYRRLSFASRFSIKDRSSNASTSPRATASAPTTPMLPPEVLKSPDHVPHRASASASAVDISSPVPSPSSPGQSRRSLSTFINFSRPRSPPLQQPLRTQPYGPPYNFPMPQPTPRSTHHKSSSTSNVVPTNRRGHAPFVNFT